MTKAQSDVVESFYREILINAPNQLTESDSIPFLELRLVHDMGITGDDFADFYTAIVAKRPTTELVPKIFVPPELSKDSYLVAMSRSWKVRGWNRIASIYRNRIRCEPLTIRQLHKILYHEDV